MNLTDHAHRMLDQGLHVFPLDHPEQRNCAGLHGPNNPCDGTRGKHPAVKFGTWATTVTHQQIDLQWDKRRGLANIGIACGPSNLVILDEDAPGELDRWADAHGITLPATYTVTTGRTNGGRHLYYRWDHTERPITNTAKALDGFKVDVRGKGGYVVGEHSRHASGAVYTGNGEPIAALPAEVAALLLAGKTKPDSDNAPVSGGEPSWEKISDASDPNTARIGYHDRHDALVAYAGRLRNKGLDYTEALPVFRQRWLLCEQPAGQIPEATYHSPQCPFPVTWDEAQAKLRDVYERYAAGQPEADDGAPEPEATTWEPIDLGPWMDGTHTSPQPTVGISRTDGQKLLYSGREHTVFGETEVGKSWFAGESAAVEIRMGRDVVYVHYEEGDPASTIERLRVLGVTPAQIARHLRFVAPARPVRGDWLKPLLDPPPALVIHDGVNEAMSLHGDDTNQTDGAATFRRTIIKPFLAVGATSLSCDHVTKNSDVRGRYAIGSAHKINAIDGAAFLMENIEPFGRGLRGASSVYVTKDRPGQLRAQGKPTAIPGKTLIGVLTVDATGDSPDFLTFYPPREKEAQESGAGPTLADEIYRVLVALPDHTAKSGRDLRAAMRDAGLKFSTDSALAAFDDLVFQGRVKEIPGRHKAVGYRAVVADSGVPQESPGHGVPSTVPFGVPPIGSGTPEHSPVSVPRNTPEHSGTLEGEPESPVCRSCGRTLTPAQESRGYCYLAECAIAAKAVNV